MDIPAEHLPAIERYTRELTDHIEKVALAALADRKPATLAWGEWERWVSLPIVAPSL
jgi:hypothetical protein